MLSFAGGGMQVAAHRAVMSRGGSAHRRLALALAASILLHSFLMLGLRPEPARPGTFGALYARLVPVSAAQPAAIETPQLPDVPQQTKATPAPERVVEMASEAPLAAATAGPEQKARQPASPLPTYFSSQDVDVRAVPMDLSNGSRQARAMLLGRVVKVKLRLYISAAGRVDRFDVLEADGLSPAVSLEEVYDIRFHPALKNGLPVASQKLVQLSFVP